MNILNKTDLFHSLFDAFRQHTDSVYFVGGENPYRFSFKGKLVTAFIGNIHFAGAGRNAPDEYRIQCPGNLPTTLNNTKLRGDTVLVLGFSADVQAFCAWDPDRFLRRNPRVRRFSVYTRLSSMQEATLRGFSTYTDNNGQNVIMFRPDLLGLYLENSTALHQATPRTLRRIAEVYSNTPLGQPLLQPIRVNRQRIRVTRTEYSRSPRFRQEVLEAYSHRCAICEIQLDLVDAAHIVPHAHPEGFDTVSNGLALCALHHRSFDTGLLYVRRDYSIHLNSAKVRHLRKVGRANGLRWYTRQLRPELLLPAYDDWLPAPDNLTLGNDLRGVGLEG